MMPPHFVCHFSNFIVRRIAVNLFWTAAKGQYIHDTGLAGFAMWTASGDSDDILLDAIKLSAEESYY